MTDKEQIEKMEEGDTIFVNMFQDGGVQIHMYNYEYLLYEIPLYGGDPRFMGIFKDVDKLINEYSSWS